MIGKPRFNYSTYFLYVFYGDRIIYHQYKHLCICISYMYLYGDRTLYHQYNHLCICISVIYFMIIVQYTTSTIIYAYVFLICIFMVVVQYTFMNMYFLYVLLCWSYNIPSLHLLHIYYYLHIYAYCNRGRYLLRCSVRKKFAKNKRMHFSSKCKCSEYDQTKCRPSPEAEHMVHRHAMLRLIYYRYSIHIASNII